jgi:hypothetical protein
MFPLLKKILFLKVFFILFLLIFSYVLLCEFYFYEIVRVQTAADSMNVRSINETTNLTLTELGSSSTKTLSKKLNQPSVLQYLLIFWVFSFFVEELRQVTFILVPVELCGTRVYVEIFSVATCRFESEKIFEAKITKLRQRPLELLGHIWLFALLYRNESAAYGLPFAR